MSIIKVAEYKEIIEKIAKEKKDKDKPTVKTIGTGAVGAKMVHSSKDRILGQKTLYHGTSKKNWDNIKKEGLRADKGGIGGAGAATGNLDYVNDSKNKVHLTGSKIKSKFYAGLGDAMEKTKDSKEVQDFSKVKEKYHRNGSQYPYIDDDIQLKEYSDAADKANKRVMKEAIKPGRGKSIKVKMDYDKYKKMEVDPDEVGGNFMDSVGKKIKNAKIRGIAENASRHQAARGSVDVGTDEIVGLHKASKRIGKTMKNMPNYIKNNKGRFSTGVALAGTGTALIGKAVSDLSKNKLEKKASYRELIYKEAQSI